LPAFLEVVGMSRSAMAAFVAFIGLAMVLGGLFCVWSAPPRTITITTGPAGSVFHTNAVRYARALASPGIELKILTSRGSLALALLEANGIKPGGNSTLLDWEPARAAKALMEGRADAVFLMGEDAPMTLLRELMRAPEIHLLSFRQAPAYTRRIGYLNALDLPEGCIDFGKNIPPADMHLIGPTVELIARGTLHPALSDLLLEAARTVHGKASFFQHKDEFPAPLEHEFRISPDAARFYKSGKTLFTSLFYELRVHIAFVRRLLSSDKPLPERPEPWPNAALL
jgi:hypothetical protein